jgi:RNA-directed DNA polymerase
MSLSTPLTVQKLQAALHAKAKESPDFRFYALYDKMYRADVLEYAYQRCQSNGGVAGVDGQTFEDIESYGREQWLGEQAERLRNKTYRPQVVRRVYIPKANGGQRPLGIPTITDRVIQMAAVVILDPIFEADLPPEQYAYRSKRSAHDALRHVHRLVNTGHTEVVDADLSGYFDSIPHAELMQSVRRRLSDGAMLHLIKMWLTMPVEEEDGRGRKQRTTRRRDEKKGTPQGAPISPLLSNLYMRRFVHGWKTLGYAARLQAQIVNYADDFVICCRHSAQPALAVMSSMMSRLKLTLNEQKTCICRLPEETFDFLGYTIGRCYSPKTGKAYYGTRPARKRIQRICDQIGEWTDRRRTGVPTEEVVAQINRALLGWSNYFCLGPVSRAYRAVDGHTRNRLRQWLRKKHKLKGRATSHFPDEHLHQKLGLVCLQQRMRRFPWAEA